MRSVSLSAEALYYLNIIGFAVRIGLRIAFAVECGLPLTNHTENLVVKNHGYYRQIIADCGARLIHIHMERAVARDMYNSPIGERNLGANCRSVAVAHSAETAACQKRTRIGMLQILSRPHLVLADIGNINSILRYIFANRPYKLMRCNKFIGIYRVIIALFVFVKGFKPIGPVALLYVM